jgi:ABC-type uncharacterized transport system permease subunit
MSERQPFQIRTHEHLGVFMDRYEKVGYTCLGVIALLYLLAIFVGMIASFPYGLLGLFGIVGIGALLIKVMKERLNNKEDDYYSKNIDR